MLASWNSERILHLFNVDTGKRQQTFSGFANRRNRSVAFSPDGRIIAAGCDNIIRLWDVNTGQLIQTIKGHTEEVWSVTFSPDGKTLASGDRDLSIRLWGCELRTTN